MNQQEILDYNKRCAEFLGGVYDGDMTNYWFHIKWGCIKWSGIFAPTTEELKFHSDWNWIHEVIEAIEKLGGAVCVGNSNSVMIVFYLTDVFGESYSKTRKLVGESKKEATTEAINKFLIWYEQNK